MSLIGLVQGRWTGGLLGTPLVINAHGERCSLVGKDQQEFIDPQTLPRTYPEMQPPE